MKNSRKILAAVFLLFALQSSAQWSFNGNHIRNTNSENVGIGISSPQYLLDVAKSMTEPTISIRNLGGNGGATLRLTDQNSNSDWKIKSVGTGGLKIRDQTNSINVITIENNSLAHSLYIKEGGNVGIGTSSPTSLLDLAKSMTEPTISIRNTGGNGGATLRLMDQNSNSDWKIKSIGTGGLKIRDQTNSINVITIENNSLAHSLYIKEGGNVGIGTNNPTSKLAVNGKINCKEVEVYLTGWSDYVFKEDYYLMPLKELESFINENKHLPGVPSQDEVIENGVNLGQMDAILLEKIEELTLYIIDLKKQNDLLQQRMSKLEN